MYESVRSMSESHVFVSAQAGRGIKGGDEEHENMADALEFEKAHK